jgi:hypothetical protein
VKYFFLTEGWTVGRVWGVEGLWNELAWRRAPQIERMNLCLLESSEKLWLYRVEDPVIMVEVKPLPEANLPPSTIGQVFIRRLMSGDQVLARLCDSQTVCQMADGMRSAKFS